MGGPFGFSRCAARRIFPKNAAHTFVEDLVLSCESGEAVTINKFISPMTFL
jgi:hypothetical protein